MKQSEEKDHRITLKLIEDNSVQISVSGDVDMLARMLYSSMLRNQTLACIVLQCAIEYEKQLESNQKAILN